METKTTRLLVTSSTTPTIRSPPVANATGGNYSLVASTSDVADAANQIELGLASHTHSHDKAEQLAEDIDEEIHKLQYKVFQSSSFVVRLDYSMLYL